MAYSTITYPGSSGFGPYQVAFPLGNLRDEYVTCRVNDEQDGGGNPIYRSLNWALPGFATITSGVEPTGADTVVFERTMPVDQLIHDYSNGAVIDEINLDESNLQLIMLCHQFLDGRLPAPFSTDLNMGFNRIINLAPAIAGQDAVNLEQMNAALEGIIGGDGTGRVKIDGSDTFGYLGTKLVGDGATIAFNKVGTQLVGSYIGIIPPLDNTMGITDPTATDDSSAGYSEGSRWFNLATNEIFICLQADVGAAVWIDITFNQEDIAPLLAAKVDKLTSFLGTSTSITLDATHADKYLHITGTGQTITVPADATYNFPLHTTIVLFQNSNSMGTVAAEGGVTLVRPAGYSLVFRARYEYVVLRKYAANTWSVVGGLAFA